MRESERISVLKGVGEKTEQLFIKAGVHTIGDLLAYYPRTYDIYEDPISIGEIQEGKDSHCHRRDLREDPGQSE